MLQADTTSVSLLIHRLTVRNLHAKLDCWRQQLKRM